MRVGSTARGPEKEVAKHRNNPISTHQPRHPSVTTSTPTPRLTLHQARFTLQPSRSKGMPPPPLPLHPPGRPTRVHPPQSRIPRTVSHSHPVARTTDPDTAIRSGPWVRRRRTRTGLLAVELEGRVRGVVRRHWRLLIEEGHVGDYSVIASLIDALSRLFVSLQLTTLQLCSSTADDQPDLDEVEAAMVTRDRLPNKLGSDHLNSIRRVLNWKSKRVKGLSRVDIRNLDEGKI